MLRSFTIAVVAFGLTGCSSDGSSPAGYAGGAGGNTGGATSGGSGGTTSGGGGAGTGGAAGEAGAAGAAGAAIDYSAGTWTNENLSKSPGTITHDARVVFVGSQEIFAWSEPDSVDTNDQDIIAGGLGSMKPVTSDTKVQNAFPVLAVADGAPVLVYNGYPGGDNDLYWAEGPGFSNPINLTEASDSPAKREDYAPSLTITTSGTRDLVYLSAPLDFAGEAEVRLLEWTGAPSALQPKSVISGKGDCDDPAIVSDPLGKLHVLTACGPLFEEVVQYATNSSGTWEVKELAATKGDNSTRLAITPDGKTLFAVWLNATGNLLFTSSDLSGTWSSPVVAVINGYSPVVAADGAGRALIAFHRDNAQKNSDVFLTWSEGIGFHPPILLTPNSDGTTEWLPSAIAFEPATGNPEVLYAGIEAGSDPLNSDVWRAKFAP